MACADTDVLFVERLAMIAEIWGNTLRMFISLESFHTNADTALLTLLCSQQGRSSTIICQQCTRIFHSSIATCREGFDILTVVPFVMPAPYRRGQAAIRVYCEGSRGWIEGPQMHPLWSDWQRSEQPEETRGEHSLPWHFLLHLQILPAWNGCQNVSHPN